MFAPACSSRCLANRKPLGSICPSPNRLYEFRQQGIARMGCDTARLMDAPVRAVAKPWIDARPDVELADEHRASSVKSLGSKTSETS